MRFLVRLLTLVLLLVSLAPAQQFWDKKPWTEWKPGDVQLLLENSPWSQAQTVSKANIQVTRRTMLGETGGENAPRITYTAQFRSAKIIRQALVRQAQLKAKYDQMSPQRKAAFDASTRPFLDGPPEPQIAVYVIFDTNVPSYRIDLQNFWQRQSTQLLQNTVFLSLPGGRKVSPVAFTPPHGEGFTFIFDRPADAMTSGEMRLEFTSPAFTDLPEQRMTMGFKIARMSAGGSVDY